MGDLTFASFVQGPLGGAIDAVDDGGVLPPPTFTPSVSLTSTVAEEAQVAGPGMRLLGPADVAGLAAGSVIRCEPSPGATDVEPNYLAVAEVVPPELPWLLTPARARNGRLRPWFVLVVVDASVALVSREPLPVIEAPIDQLPDLRDSWGWAHVQRTTGGASLPGGGQAAASAVGRLVCPRRLADGVTYRACLVPAFASGVAAGLGDGRAAEVAHDLAWNVDTPGTVRLPVYHSWAFTTGPSGDFEELVTRLRPADPEQLRAASVRPVDVRSPWMGDPPLAGDAQIVGVQGALVPFGDPPTPESAATAEVLAAFDARIRTHLDARAGRLAGAAPGDVTGSVAPPLYGGRHVVRDTVGGPDWLIELNTSIARRLAAGLGVEYVRTNQEDLMAKAWEQVGAIRAANRLRAMAELTTNVAESVHRRHVSSLRPGELVSFAAPASARTMTAPGTSLATETAMSRMVAGAESTAFARRLRPDGKLAQRAGVSATTLVPRALRGEVTMVDAAPVIPASPTLSADGVVEISATVVADQLVVLDAFARVATLNQEGSGGATLIDRLGAMVTEVGVGASISVGDRRQLANAIVGQVTAVTSFTTELLAELGANGAAPLGSLDARGVPIDGDALGGRLAGALWPAHRHFERVAAMVSLPDTVSLGHQVSTAMACPRFAVPTALTLLQAAPEWFMPGLGAVPVNTVALLRPNNPFVEAYLAGINQEMMGELLWREYPTDQRGTPFRRFWPRPDDGDDVAPLHEWIADVPLGAHSSFGESLTVLLVRGDVVRRYPGMLIVAARSGPPDDAGRHRPDRNQPVLPPSFMIEIDEMTVAYGFAVPASELQTPATADAPGWFFVFSEHGDRLRFGFDEPPDPGEAHEFLGWSDVTWPSEDGRSDPAFVPVARGHAMAGTPFPAPFAMAGAAPTWAHDAADIARITLQRPFRVAIQADVLLRPEGTE